MPPETTKERAARIADRKYFQRPDRLTRVKNGLSLAALALTLPLLIWVGVVLASGRGACVMSPGPVTAAHAPWDDRCDACHQPFQGIHNADRCDTCHARAAHFAGQSAEANRCASCHAEHGGRGASLVRPLDAACTGCHRDLPAVRPGVDVAFQHTVRALADDHTLESRSVRTFDPNKDRALKFSHAVHLSPGMALDRNNPRPFRLGDIADKVEKDRYGTLQGTTGEGARVQLDCRACHRLDAADFGFKDGAPAGVPRAAVLPQRAAGGNPLPITYENQCKACHPLTFDDKEPSLTAPHRAQPAQLHTFLEGTYAARLVADRLPLRELRIGADWRLDRPEEPRLREARKALDEVVAVAERKLTLSGNGCAKCHLFDNPEAPFARQTVRPARARDVWYEHARFSHVAHRAVSCQECHAAAAPAAEEAPPPLIELEAPLVPEVAKCRDCHGPRQDAGGGPRGVARADCAECHRYHNGGAPSQGIGAAARDPGRRLDRDTFLGGGPHDGGSGPARPAP